MVNQIDVLPRWASSTTPGAKKLISIPAAIFFFGVVALSLGQLLFYTPNQSYSTDIFSASKALAHQTEFQNTTNKHLSQLQQQLKKIATYDESDWCHAHHSIDRLSFIALNEQPMCKEESAMTCYEAPNIEGQDYDNFCTFQNLETIVKDEKPFQLTCSDRTSEMRRNITSKGQRLITMDTLSKHMFWTGAGELMPNFFQVSSSFGSWFSSNNEVENSEQINFIRPARWTILLKREVHGSHPWHSLMEIGQLFNTMDALSLAGKWNLENDRDDTQIILLDDEPNIEHMDLARIISSRPLQRWTELKAQYANSRVTFPNAIIPLAGGGHPIWRSDWNPYPCTKSEVVDLLVDRIRNLYDVKNREATSEKVKVIFVTRPNHRSLQDREAHFNRWQEKFGQQATFEMLNFNDLSIKRRIEILSNTDVLIGVHGSQLTNLLYMPRRVASVVEILPKDFFYYGFRNLANVRGLRYFKTSAIAQTDTKNWQETSGIIADQNDLDNVVGAAIQSVLRTSLRGS